MSAFGLNWRIRNLLDDSNQGSPTPIPHAIIETVSHVPANYADQSLTRHEVRAIVNTMLIRTSHRPFRRYPIHPVSNLYRMIVLSHTNPLSLVITSLLYGRKTRKDHSSFI